MQEFNLNYDVHFYFPIASENTGKALIDEESHLILELLLLSHSRAIVHVNGPEMITTCIYLVENPLIKNNKIFILKETKPDALKRIYSYLKEHGQIIKIENYNAELVFDENRVSPILSKLVLPFGY